MTSTYLSNASLLEIELLTMVKVPKGKKFRKNRNEVRAIKRGEKNGNR